MYPARARTRLLDTNGAFLYTYRAMSDHSHGPAQPALLHAAEQGDLEAVERLLLQGHEVNGCDHLGWTALHEAVLNNGDAGVCRMLLRHGANVAIPNHYGETPLHLAAANETTAAVDLCRLLLEHGASVSAADDQSKLPYDIAEERGGQRPREQQDTLRILLRRSASVPRRLSGLHSVLWGYGYGQEGLSIEAIVALLGLLALLAWLNGWVHSTTIAFMAPLPAARVARTRLVHLE